MMSMSIAPITTSVLLAGACYGGVKALTYLCTRPSSADRRIGTIFTKIRESCAEIKESIVRMLGERRWEIWSHVIADNAWISTLMLSLVILGTPEGIGKITTTVATVGEAIRTALSITYIVSLAMTIAMTIYLSRAIIAVYLPGITERIAAFVAPRGFYNSSVQNGDFLSLRRISQILRDDSVLNARICPITHAPILHPVGDPNGVTVYERRAIEDWIRRHGEQARSPVTNEPLQFRHLQDLPELQATIYDRLCCPEVLSRGVT